MPNIRTHGRIQKLFSWGVQNMYIVILLNLGFDIWLKIIHIEEISVGVQTPFTPSQIRPTSTPLPLLGEYQRISNIRQIHESWDPPHLYYITEIRWRIINNFSIKTRWSLVKVRTCVRWCSVRWTGGGHVGVWRQKIRLADNRQHCSGSSVSYSVRWASVRQTATTRRFSRIMRRTVGTRRTGKYRAARSALTGTELGCCYTVACRRRTVFI